MSERFTGSFTQQEPIPEAGIAAALAVPIFAFRHYVQDKGRFPDHMMADLGLTGGSLGERKAGILPYLTLAGGIAVMLAAHFLFTLE